MVAVTPKGQTEDGSSLPWLEQRDTPHHQRVVWPLVCNADVLALPEGVCVGGRRGGTAQVAEEREEPRPGQQRGVGALGGLRAAATDSIYLD